MQIDVFSTETKQYTAIRSTHRYNSSTNCEVGSNASEELIC